MSERPVFSTKPSVHDSATDPKQKSHGPLASGPIKMRLETKGRGGKAVTVLFNLPMSEDVAIQLGKELQQKLGVGGTFKDGAIELRGDLRDKVEKLLATRNMAVKRAGG